MEIISKGSYERFDWKKKIMEMSVDEARKWQFEEYNRCKADKIYWMNQYVWIIDVKQLKILPFIPWEHQLRLIKQLDKYEDTFIDKSREMGISWSIMAWELWNVQFRHAFSALNISRKESEVQDSGNTFHALMGRLYFMWERQPPFIKPKIHNPFLSFQVPAMNSVIKGESANPNAGRDTQYTFIFIDEAAHIKCLDEMWKGVRGSSENICLNSTPPKEIVNSKFVEIRDKRESGFTHISFHWKERPDRTDEWYEKKTASMEADEIAQELEINYDLAQTNRSYPEYNEDIHLLTHRVYYNKNFQLMTFMDFGLDGEVFLLAQKDHQNRLYIIDYNIYKNMLTYELYKEYLTILNKIGYKGKIKDILFVGDTAGTRRSRQTKTSVIDEYYKVSSGEMIIRHQEISNWDKMLCVRHILRNTIEGKPQLQVSHANSCRAFSKCMKYISFNKKRDDHVDNKYTHAVNAFEYGVSWLFPLKKAEMVIVGADPIEEGMRMVGFAVEEGQPQPIIPFEDVSPHQVGKNRVSGSASIHSVTEQNRLQRRSLIW